MSAMPKVLVTGSDGQDGRLAIERLEKLDYAVVAVGRRVTPALANAQNYVSLDLRNHQALDQLLLDQQPDWILHLAAVHGASGFVYEPLFADVLDVNVKALHRMLEYARLASKQVRLFYASSMKVFQTPLPPIVDETSPKAGSCLYSISKIAAADLARYYQNHHGVQTAVGYLFNHESRYRARHYFIPKLAEALKRAKAGETEKVQLASLNFFGNWSDAAEFMSCAIDLLAHTPGSDYIFASEQTIAASELVEQLFDRHGFDWRDFLDVAEPVKPTSELTGYFLPNTEKLRDVIGHGPSRSIFDLIDEMADLLRLTGSPSSL